MVRLKARRPRFVPARAGDSCSQLSPFGLWWAPPDSYLHLTVICGLLWQLSLSALVPLNAS